MKKIISLLSLLLSFTLAYPQSGFKKTYFLTSDSVNRITWPDAIRPCNLATLLIDGFRKGKIRCFGDPIVNDAVYGPARINPDWKSWNAKKVYEPDDTVTYQQKYYACYRQTSSATEGLTPDISPDWEPFLPYKPLIKNDFHLPFAKDGLTQEEFYSRMVKGMNYDFRELAGSWDPGKKYSAMERVEFRGNVYMASVENVGVPITELDTWIDQGPMANMYEPGYMTFIGLFEYYEVQHGDTLFFPQLLSFGAQGNDGTYSTILYFNFQDAIAYLETLKQPAIIAGQSWRYGLLKNNSFLFANDEQKFELTCWIRRKIKSGQLKINKKDRKGSDLLEKFIQDERFSTTAFGSTPYYSFDCPWSVCYSTKNTQELYLTYNNSGMFSNVVIHVPVNSIVTLLAKEPGYNQRPALLTYAQALTARNFRVRSSELVEVDNLSAVTKNSPACKEQRQFMFLETFSASKNNLVFPNVQKAGNSLIELLRSGRVPTFGLSGSYYEMRELMELSQIDSSWWSNPMVVTGLLVIFETSFSRDDVRFYRTPRYLSAVCEIGGDIQPITYFKIDDLKKYADQHSDEGIGGLLHAIDNNQIEFSRCEVLEAIRVR